MTVEPDQMPWWKRYLYRVVAAEVSSIVRYYDAIVQLGQAPGDSGHLLSEIDCPKKSQVEQVAELESRIEKTGRTAVLLNGTLNHELDVQGLLTEMRPLLSRGARLIAVTFNPYLQWLYSLAHRVGLKAGVMPTTFLTMADVDNLCRVSGYERVRVRQAVYVPWRLLGIGSIVNRIMPAIPLLKHLALTNIIVLRPLIDDGAPRLTLSIVIPARNERGNIRDAIQRLPAMAVDVEVIFVEGHSSDGTWEEIERVAEEGRATGLTIQTFRQTGKGKADAVRLGFANATGDLLTILDADLTMPPELLPRFVDAYLSGAADFINGSRIVYPMEGEAMRFLNRLGNVFFAKALTSVLGVRLGDSLCGTKLMRRDDYARMIEWRRDFGDFDPFGDFELLFPAAVLALGMVDVPIRYRARTYGETQISRFSHGFMLLRMTIIGFFRIKLGRTRLTRG
jgi:hypothetical protein